MSIRNVIKRERISGEDVPPPLPSKSHARPATGTRLVELETGRYAIEHTCRCGEVALLELEVDARAPAEEARA